MQKVMDEISNSKFNITTIDNKSIIQENLLHNELPPTLGELSFEHYSDFLQSRRKLMAEKIKKYYYNL